MLKGKINKKTAIIAVLLMLATIISVFAISKVIQANKTTTNISPYKYGLVVVKYGYWKDGDTYYADVFNERKNIGAVPSEHVEFDLTFPTTLISGNYEIDEIIDFERYTGSWDELNYNRMEEDKFKKHRVTNASVWNPQAYIGEKNTEVTFTASFKLLNPPEQGLPGSRFALEVGPEVYECYIGVVIKYVDSDFLDDPEGWWRDHGGNPDEPDPDPGTGDVLVYVWHKEKGTEKSIADLQKVRTSLGKNLVLSGLDISGYKCVSSKIKGLATKEYDKNYIDEIVGRYDYITPDRENLDVTFYYDKSNDKPSDDWCEPDLRLETNSARIKMKRREYEKAENLYFPNVEFAISELKFGHGKDGEEMPGIHGFESWDIYFKYGDRGYDYQRTGLHDKRVDISLSVPKHHFESNEDNTVYSTNVEVHAGLNCLCGGFGVDKRFTSLYVDIIENKPPEAYYEYSSVKTLPSGKESKVNNKAYIGKDVVIDNHCSDPNGLTDIDFARFNFKNLDDPSQVKSIKLIMKPWGVYEVGEYDLFDDTSIDFKQIVNGNLRMIFTNDDEWEVSVYVQDLDGANDMYTNIIKPEELSLKPTAVIKDTREYRYPEGHLFNGKQNRVIRLDSNDSYVASWLDDMDVIINHNNDEWKIEPLDGQDINCVKFEKDLNKITSGNILTARYEPLDLKMIFKESGRYKISLQVTDTEGNVSNWAEQIVIIHEDLPPTVTANVNPKYYRDENGSATITVRNINMESIDLDNVSIEKIEYRYDSNNDGNFGNWDILSENSLATTDLGIYQFKLTVKESFGQETIQEHITDSDYKRGEIILQTEVDNIAPNITKFKIMRSE